MRNTKHACVLVRPKKVVRQTAPQTLKTIHIGSYILRSTTPSIERKGDPEMNPRSVDFTWKAGVKLLSQQGA